MKNFIVSFFSVFSIAPFTKIFCLVAILSTAQHLVNAQGVLFSEDFENGILSPAWQSVSGNWRIAEVHELKIPAAEDRNQYVLSSSGPGIIRLFIDIPDTVKAGQVKLSFSYYAKMTGATVELAFHKKDLKDGLKGKRWKAALPAKKTWVIMQKTLSIRAGANLIWLSFFETGSVKDPSKITCIDNVVVLSVR